MGTIREEKLREKLTYMHEHPAQTGLTAPPRDWTFRSACRHEQEQSVGVSILRIESSPLVPHGTPIAKLSGPPAVSASNVVKYAAFVSPLVLVVGAAAYAMWVDAQAIKNTGVCDGSGDVAWFMLKAYLVGLVIACVCLIALGRMRDIKGARHKGDRSMY